MSGPIDFFLQGVGRLTHSRSATGKTRDLNLLLYPGFQDLDDFSDIYHRILWYTNPMVEDVRRISIGLDFPTPKNPPVPPYLDGRIPAVTTPDISKKLSYFSEDDTSTWRRRLDEADIVLHWNRGADTPSHFSDTELARAFSSKRVWAVDRRRDRFESSFWLKLSSEANPRLDLDLRESQEKLSAVIERLKSSEKGYLFGTGPSLSQAFDFDFSDGTTIACNSMVKNIDLLEHIQPSLFAVADPVFHAGCSSYAGEFRRHLSEALRRFPGELLVPFRDYRLYVNNLPEFSERIIGVPLVNKKTVNLDLSADFSVTSTGNILTLLLLPLAATCFDSIDILGCDGRPAEENDYFWSHDRTAQLSEHMAAARQAHPGFFDIDYDDYYFEHCETLEKWLASCESQGLSVRSLTDSHIPALKKRSVTPV